MNNIKKIEGDLVVKGSRFGIVITRWNSFVVENLLEVAGDCVKGMASSMMEYEIPVAFGVLTVDTIEQAIERAGTKAGNKGEEAALSAIEMVNLLRNIT